MIPDIHSTPAVAREIVHEYERKIARRQILDELPEVPPRSVLLLRRVCCCMGKRLINLGQQLSRYGGEEFSGTPTALQSR